VVDTECEGERGHLAARSEEMEGRHFRTVTCGLVTTGIWKERGAVSGCVKSETAKKKRPSAKMDGTQSRALHGATGIKNGVKSGGFWQPLSQDVALMRKMVAGAPPRRV
jgi:hypothetical protein